MEQSIKMKIHQSLLKKRPEVKVGDTVKLYLKIKEGDKERSQMFEGVVIQKRGSGVEATITVRKMSGGIGVEKIVPLHAPTLDKIEVVKRGKVKRSKLFYMRSKIGKRALKVGNIQDVYFTDEVDEPQEQASTEEVAQ